MKTQLKARMKGGLQTAASRVLRAAAMSLAIVAAQHRTPAAEPAAPEARPGRNAPAGAFEETGDEFKFDTGVLRGKLRAGGKSFGLTSVVHVPTGRRLARSMGLFGLYRVFSDRTRYGAGAWDWPSEATLERDGSVAVRCAPAADRPFELRGIYRWSSPVTLDFEVQVRPQKELRGFEAFLASYFDAAFSNALAYVAQPPRSPNQPGFVAAEQPLGDWQMFPRDAQAVTLIGDGRWKLPPNPVDWTIMPKLALPVAVRRAPDSGLTAVLMSPRSDCFAIGMPHQTEGHGSVYLSLFGRDLKAGETAVARARLMFLSRPDESQILAVARAFAESPPGRK